METLYSEQISDENRSFAIPTQNLNPFRAERAQFREIFNALGRRNR